MSLSSFLNIKDCNKSLVYRIYYIFLCSGAMSTLLGAMLPAMQAEYSMSYALRGYVLSSHQIGNFFAVFLSGFIPYAIGRKKSTLILGSLIVLGLLLMTATGNPFILIVAFAFTGMGRGTLSNITNVVVSENTGNKAAGLNILHASFAIGAFISPFVAVFATAIEWRIAAWIFAFLMLTALIFVGGSTLSNTPMKKVKTSSEIPFQKSFSFWLNTFIMFFYLAGEASLTGWLVTYFNDTGLMSTSLSQSMQSFLWVMILLGRLCCASLSSKMDKSVLILAMGAMMTLCFVLMISAQSTALVVIGLLGLGFFMSGIYPTTLSTMDSRYNSSTVATGTCIATATVGGILMPIIIGEVAEVSGIRGGVATISVALAIMVILMVIKLIRSRRNLQ